LDHTNFTPSIGRSLEEEEYQNQTLALGESSIKILARSVTRKNADEYTLEIFTGI
tara:strand:- start:14678 stop:14842 length:165 start_codon:yes stop_codon:yes gene_type:complete